MLLDLNAYETFVIDFQTSVVDMRLKNPIPGRLYTFVMRQDAKGNHRLQWASDAHNGMMLNPTPRSVTVQTFIAAKDGNLYAVPPGTWT